MTANIPQHVVRRRTLTHHTYHQAGSVSHSTMILIAGIVLLISVSAIGFLYLQQVLTTASSGTEIQTLERKLSDLEQSRRALELKSAELKSLKTVEENVKTKLNLVAADSVAYLVVIPDEVATIAR